MTQTATTTVRSLFIPVENVTLLLPGTVVAEVVPYEEAEAAAGEAPEWFLGTVPWREQRIPLVSIDGFMTGESVPAGQRARIAVLKALSNQDSMPYFGIVTRQIPRLVAVYDEGIEPIEDAAAGLPGVAAEVLVNGEPAVVPDLDQIERALHAAVREMQLR